jgi:thiol-disulfide isomerase/thioredoxin
MTGSDTEVHVVVWQPGANRLTTVGIAIILLLTLVQSVWLGYTFLVRPKLEANRLPAAVTDFRGKALPSLEALVPVADASLSRELEAPVTVVAFLLTTCPACNSAKPTLEALKQDNKETVGLIGIFAESDEAVANYEADYPLFLDSDREVFSAFSATSVPMILVEKDGKVVSQSVGWSPEIGKRLRAVVGNGG